MSKKENEPSLQKQLADLDELLEWFEKPDIDLDEALLKFDEGVQLAQSAREKLSKLENKITILKQKFGEE